MRPVRPKNLSGTVRLGGRLPDSGTNARYPVQGGSTYGRNMCRNERRSGLKWIPSSIGRDSRVDQRRSRTDYSGRGIRRGRIRSA